MQKIINSILNSISSASASFLEDDMSVEIIDKNYEKDVYAQNFYGAVKLSSDLNLICIIVIEKKLLNHILKIFLPDIKDEEETYELRDEMSKEIANTIVGLSISKFPIPYNEMSMSPPLEINEKEIKNLLAKYPFLENTIQTNLGFLKHFVVKI